MTQNKIIYKSIDKWAQRPGCVATATILLETEPHGPVEIDIFTKKEAIDITLDLIATLTIWIRHYEEVLSKVPSLIREYLWNADKNKFIYNNSAEDLKKLRTEHDRLLLTHYPARSMVSNLTQMKKDRDNYEKLFTYFNSL
jgi:hypothetical protein